MKWRTPGPSIPKSSPALTAGDVDADWATAYSSGDEAPGGDMPTPDQGVVEDIGAALGVGYADDEELRGADKIEDRDRHRWELDPASADDYEGSSPGRKTAQAKIIADDDCRVTIDE